MTISSTVLAMTNLKGQPTSIHSYVGKGNWLIVQAWTSSCGVCDKEMPKLVKASRSFPNTRVIGVSLDENKVLAKRFIAKHRVNFPTLFSTLNEFDRYLKNVAGEGLTGTPTFLIFNPKGKLVGMQNGNVSPVTLRRFISKKN